MNRLPETNSGVVTSWIPVPTVHPHQAGCENLLWQYVPNVIAAWDPGYGIEVDTKATCLPKAATTWWLQDRFGPISDSVFSLGPVTCPQDYYTATVSAKDATSTFIACCPFNYGFASFMAPGNTGQCTSKLKKGDIVTFAQRDSGWKITSSTATEATTVAAVQVNGWTFATPTESTTESATDGTHNCDASITQALASQIATGNASCDATCSHSQISAGAAAGIGIGVSFGVTGLAALGAGLFMMYRRRKAAPKRPAAAHIAQFANGGGKDMDTSTHALPTYSPDTRDTPSPSERPQYQQYERDVWDASTPCLPLPQSSTHSNARTLPHGEMEGTSFQTIDERTAAYQPIDERTRRRMELEGTPYHNVDNRTTGAAVPGSSLQGSEEEAKRRMELEGEFDRNVKVSLSTPWLASIKPVLPPSSSHYHPPY
ncbi:hypothetical protein F4677DRAFT_196371 [Hypoxylon crocopeplum]|nr:hypothetical protein F4677DRAFT_196371 [Hypoxylon crocopeplum]